MQIFYSHRTDEVVHLPYYGGAKGQTLEVVHNKDGTISTSIIRNDDASHLKDKTAFQVKLQNIQEAAAQLVTIQENAKNKGTFSVDDSKAYADNLQQLGIAAQELAQLQQEQTGNNDITMLFNPQQVNKVPQKNQNNVQKFDLGNPPDDHVDDVYTDLDPTVQQDPDSVQVSVPSKDASVAEAKPVGLSIAGEGGVASSKPVGTAISGEKGLAVARPVATAIAGVTPNEVANLGLPLPNRIRKTSLRPEEYKYRLRNDGYLAGPAARIALNGEEIEQESESERGADIPAESYIPFMARFRQPVASASVKYPVASDVSLSNLRASGVISPRSGDLLASSAQYSPVYYLI